MNEYLIFHIRRSLEAFGKGRLVLFGAYWIGRALITHELLVTLIVEVR